MDLNEHLQRVEEITGSVQSAFKDLKNQKEYLRLTIRRLEQEAKRDAGFLQLAAETVEDLKARCRYLSDCHDKTYRALQDARSKQEDIFDEQERVIAGKEMVIQDYEQEIADQKAVITALENEVERLKPAPKVASTEPYGGWWGIDLSAKKRYFSDGIKRAPANWTYIHASVVNSELEREHSFLQATARELEDCKSDNALLRQRCLDLFRLLQKERATVVDAERDKDFLQQAAKDLKTARDLIDQWLIGAGGPLSKP